LLLTAWVPKLALDEMRVGNPAGLKGKIDQGVHGKAANPESGTAGGGLPVAANQATSQHFEQREQFRSPTVGNPGGAG
jgi:hypothetical protein